MVGAVFSISTLGLAAITTIIAQFKHVIINNRKSYKNNESTDKFLSDGLKERTIAYARKQQLKTVAVCYRQDWTDENRICIDPLEWMGYLKRAKAIVTNTFHGTIFSIKTGVPFVTELNDAIRLKTISMIEKLGIENHVYFNQSTLDDMLSVPCDLPRVQNLIQDWANEARQCLGSSLGD